MNKNRVVIGLWAGLFILFLMSGLALAQDETAAPDASPDAPQGGISIHVVQRDETLFRIAQRYGTTIDALITINNLQNADRLDIGQRLIIPAERSGSIGVLTRHIVEPGETLATIAARYSSTPQSLAQANKISHIDRLYAGQELLVTQGADGRVPYEVASLHSVQAGDTLISLAARYNIPLLDLARANDLDLSQPLQVGQRLILPNTAAGERFVQLPAPMLDLQISPLPAMQGRSLSAYVRAGEGLRVTGRLFDRDVTFFEQDGAHYAFIGVHSLLEPAIYPFSISLTDEGGGVTTYQSRIQVLSGGYSSETINLPEDRQALLNAAIVGPELERITELMTGYNEPKYWSGLMSLPSTGPVTSRYGTRRAYNASDYNTFHSGADFGGAPSSPILAPADGLVVFASPLQVRGNVVILDHGWGVYTGYWHTNEMMVSVGQYVERGSIIATLGNTGLSTGAHLHWEMWVGGVQVDPLQWLTHAFDQFEQRAEASPNFP